MKQMTYNDVPLRQFPQPFRWLLDRWKPSCVESARKTNMMNTWRGLKRTANSLWMCFGAPLRPVVRCVEECAAHTLAISGQYPAFHEIQKCLHRFSCQWILLHRSKGTTQWRSRGETCTLEGICWRWAKGRDHQDCGHFPRIKSGGFISITQSAFYNRQNYLFLNVSIAESHVNHLFWRLGKMAKSCDKYWDIKCITWQVHFLLSETLAPRWLSKEFCTVWETCGQFLLHILLLALIVVNNRSSCN